MSYTVNFYSFSKRENSTKQPSGSGTALSCEIRYTSSILTPELQLTSPINNPSNLNYAYIPTFNRYYWVTDWSYDRGFWYCRLAVDVLASYKSEIGASSEYVLRSASAYNQYLNDAIYPTRADCLTDDVAVPQLSCLEDGSVTLNSGHCFVIGIQNGAGDQNGGITYYAMSTLSMKTLLDYMFNTASFLDATDISLELQKELVNPFQYISSINWFPFDIVPSSLTSAKTLQFGYWTAPANVYGYEINTRTLTFSASVTLKSHPDSSGKAYLNSAPYTRHVLYANSFGQIPIDPSYFVSQHTMVVKVHVDLFTGMGDIQLTDPNGNNIYKQNGSIGAPAQISQVTQSLLGSSLNVVGGAVGLAYGNVVGYAQGIISGLESVMPQIATTGAVGSSVDWDSSLNMRVVSTFYRQVSGAVAKLGRPLCEQRTINTLSGYIQVENADVESNATYNESISIKSFMESGFYFE